MAWIAVVALALSGLCIQELMIGITLEISAEMEDMLALTWTPDGSSVADEGS
jgi:hypothetical protein